MNRRIAMSTALCTTLLAAGAFAVPNAQAGNVAWGVSIGGPGFSVAAGQPGYYGGRGYYGAPYRPVARPYYRPYYAAPYRPVVVAPALAYAPPVVYPYYAPAPVAYATSRIVIAPRPYAYGYRAFAGAPMPYAPGAGSY
jgi:hypothetical protein